MAITDPGTKAVTLKPDDLDLAVREDILADLGIRSFA